MAISGHVSRRMIEHYSHIRMEAKRVALDAIANPQSSEAVFEAAVNQNVNQVPTDDSKASTNSWWKGKSRARQGACTRPVDW